MPCFFCCLYHLAISYLDYTFEHLWKLADTINGFNFAYCLCQLPTYLYCLVVLGSKLYTSI